MVCFYCQRKVLKNSKYIINSKIFNKSILICKICKILFCNISQKKLNNFYKYNYYKNLQKVSIKYGRSKIHVKKIINYFNTNFLKYKINIIDYGAGSGYTLSQLKKIYPNSNLYAYENAKNLLSRLKKIGVKVFYGDPLKRYKEEPKTYDIIIASHFIEHLSPKILDKFLRKIFEKMNNNSILIVEVPNEYKDKLKFQTTPHTLFFSRYFIKKIFKPYFKILALYNYTMIPKNFYERLKIKLYKIFGEIKSSSKGELILIIAKKLN